MLRREQEFRVQVCTIQGRTGVSACSSGRPAAARGPTCARAVRNRSGCFRVHPDAGRDACATSVAVGRPENIYKLTKRSALKLTDRLNLENFNLN